MSTPLFALIALSFLFGVCLGMFLVLVLGIRTHDRRRNVHDQPRNRAEAASRCLLVCVRNPRQDTSDTEGN